MIGKKVWVWSGRNKGLQATVISNNGSEYFVDFGRKMRLKEFDMIVNDWYWVKHTDVEEVTE